MTGRRWHVHPARHAILRTPDYVNREPIESKPCCLAAVSSPWPSERRPEPIQSLTLCANDTPFTREMILCWGQGSCSMLLDASCILATLCMCFSNCQASGMLHARYVRTWRLLETSSFHVRSLCEAPHCSENTQLAHCRSQESRQHRQQRGAPKCEKSSLKNLLSHKIAFFRVPSRHAAVNSLALWVPKQIMQFAGTVPPRL